MQPPTEKVVELSKISAPNDYERAYCLLGRQTDNARVLEHKPAETRRAVHSTRTTRMRAPTEIVEHDTSVPTVVKKRCDVPQNVDKTSYEPKEVLRQKRLIIEEDNALDQIEEVDQLLARTRC